MKVRVGVNGYAAIPERLVLFKEAGLPVKGTIKILCPSQML